MYRPDGSLPLDPGFGPARTNPRVRRSGSRSPIDLSRTRVARQGEAGSLVESGMSAPPGVPPGVLETVLEILRQGPGPIRRRKILEKLEERGRTVSLAGLNRLLDHTRRSGLTVESPEGVRLSPSPPAAPIQRPLR